MKMFVRACKRLCCSLLVASAAVALTAGVVSAAPGDPVAGHVNVAQGGVNNHDPYFQDYNRPYGMAALSNGSVVFTWRARNNTGATPQSPDGDNYGAFFRIINASGALVGAAPQFPYNDINAGGTGRQNTPMVTALVGGGFAMTWNSAGGPTDVPAGNTGQGDAWVRVFSNTGVAVSGTTRVNESEPSGTNDDQNPEAIVALPDGGFAILWSDENDNTGNTDDYFVRTFNANGSARGASTRLGSHDAYFERSGFNRLSLVALSNSNVAATWSTDDPNFATNNSPGADGLDSAQFVRVFNANGAPVTAPIFPYADINAAGTGQQGGGLIVALSGGGFAAVWNSVNGPGDVFDDGFGYGGDTYVRVFSNTGVAVSATTRVNDLFNDDEETPSGLVALKDGGFVVVWKDEENATGGNKDDYYVRAYNANGTARNPSLSVTTGSGALFEDFDTNYGIVALSDNGFAVGTRVRDSNNDGSGTSLDGNNYTAALGLFNANGTARIRNIFPYADINPDRSGAQNTPLLAEISAGGFAAIWNSAYNSNDGANNDQGAGSNSTSGGDAWTRLMANNGTGVHATARVHDTEPTGTIDEQYPVGLVEMSGGGYAVAFLDQNDNTGNTDDYFIRMFQAASPSPSVSIAVAPASVTEDGAGNLVYTVTRSLNLASSTVVNITTGGTATAGGDYTGNVATVTIPAGATTATVTINPTVDGTVEPDETVTLTVAAGSGYTVGSPSSATGTILNDDVPTATIAVSPTSVAEDGAANLIYTVTLNQAAFSAISVNYTVSGTATNGTDYASIASPLVINAGFTTGTITVNPTADVTIEPDETVTLTLSAGTGYTVGAPNNATGTILNDDLPNLTINDVTASEGNAGITNFTFSVNLSAPAGPGGVTFNIATANGTATAVVDYVAQSLTSQTIPAGSSSYLFTVQVNGDTLNEPTETFFTNVTSVVNAVVVDGQGVGTIVNDDPLPSISINDVTVLEGNAGSANAVFTVSLSAASGQTVTVNYATADGTATAPADYTSSSGTVNFAPGQTVRTIGVPVIGETVPEANETYFVNLSGATNATIADNQGVGTITNDDVPVTVSPGALPNGTVAAAYSQTITASGGVSPYSFAVTAGALPAGLSLSPAGILSGTPTAGGTFSFTVTASDSSPSPGPFSGTQAYLLTIDPATILLPATTLADGTLGSPYSASITAASGGTAPYAYAVTAGALPGGLAPNASTGAITGTPNALGTFNFSITATDSSTGTGPYTATQGYSIVVVDVPPVASNSSLTVAFNAAATNVPLNLSGGTPTSLSITSPAVNGTALVTGPTTITYQPIAGYAGSDSFTYTATNSGGTSAPATVSVTVQDAVITITNSGSLAATVGIAYNETFTFNGGTQPWSSYQVTSLPAGLSIAGNTANTVTISGTPTQAGSFNLNVSGTDSSTGNGPYSVGQGFVLTVAAPTLTLAPAPTTFNPVYATPFSQSFTAGGGIGPYTYAVTGTLPTGLSLSGDTVSGTPTVPGNYVVLITATDTGSSGAGSPFSIGQSYTFDVAAPTIAVAPATLPDTTAGLTYSQTLSASGGVAPYTFAVTAGVLPDGLNLTAGGALSGTSTTAATSNFTVTATDANGQPGAQAYTVVVAVPTLTLTPATLPAGAVGAAYSQTLASVGGIAPYSVVLTGTLPAGLTFDTATATFSGTPTEAGTFNLSVTATDSTGGTAATVTNNYTLTIDPPGLVLSPAAGPLGATYNTAFTQTFSVTGGVGPYTYAITTGTLPTGLGLSGDTLSGTPTQTGSFPITVTATDTGTTGGALRPAGLPFTVSADYTINVAPPVITLSPATLAGGTVGVAYAQNLSASGGIGPYTFTVATGSLPPGLSLSPAGAISGSPTANGSYAFSAEAADANGLTGTAAYNIVIAALPLTLGPGSLPGGSVGAAYLQNLQPGGGVPPYQFVVSGGALPPGLSLGADGTLSGTPTQNGSFSFTVELTDSAVPASSVSRAYTLLVGVPAIAGPELVPATNQWALLLMGLLVVLVGTLAMTRCRE